MQSPCLHHQRAGTATTLSSFFCLRMLLIHMQRRPAEAAAAAAAQPRWNTVHLRRGESRVRQHIHVHNQNGCLCRAVSFPALNNKKKERKERKMIWNGESLSPSLSLPLSLSLSLCVSLSFLLAGMWVRVVHSISINSPGHNLAITQELA